ncbi:hypothetical protein Hlac_3428 (plasmid) [Halorubrum lacusprofundi ATCC 49239]|jgi:hypothetical protein|uniref:Uncharacterized protein n=1 Tax=Halorubrum lacusprofundi (strain ATCC 49239 / DSM 5036 / JCM 8891 / ACAM 34) TaxID=416348 RepID=B9LWU9_HALLT|nr:hypothetical protein Hlac_3428 [Halorubrum lacusprofundi ATCC 49239]
MISKIWEIDIEIKFQKYSLIVISRTDVSVILNILINWIETITNLRNWLVQPRTKIGKLTFDQGTNQPRAFVDPPSEGPTVDA